MNYTPGRNLLTNNPAEWKRSSMYSGVYANTYNRIAPAVHNTTIPVLPSQRMTFHVYDETGKENQQWYVGIHQLDEDSRCISDTAWHLCPYTLTTYAATKNVRITIRNAKSFVEDDNNMTIADALAAIGDTLGFMLQYGEQTTEFRPAAEDKGLELFGGGWTWDVIATDDVTICHVRDIVATTWYYKLQSSTLAPPAKPTAATPDGWTTTEPTYTEGSTNSLYVVEKTTFSDGTFEYADVSLSSSYEAAKAAYNRAANLDSSLNAEGVFNRLTNNGASQGIYMENGELYINMSYLKTGALVVKDHSSNNEIAKFDATNKTAMVGGWNVVNGALQKLDGSTTLKLSASDKLIGMETTDSAGSGTVRNTSAKLKKEGNFASLEVENKLVAGGSTTQAGARRNIQGYTDTRYVNTSGTEVAKITETLATDGKLSRTYAEKVTDTYSDIEVNVTGGTVHVGANSLTFDAWGGGSVNVPTQAQGDNSTKVATTAYVDAAKSSLAKPLLHEPELITDGTTGMFLGSDHPFGVYIDVDYPPTWDSTAMAATYMQIEDYGITATFASSEAIGARTRRFRLPLRYYCGLATDMMFEFCYGNNESVSVTRNLLQLANRVLAAKGWMDSDWRRAAATVDYCAYLTAWTGKLDDAFVDHNPYHELTADDIAAAKAAVEPFTLSYEIAGSGLTAVTNSVNINVDGSVEYRVYLAHEDGVTVTAPDDCTVSGDKYLFKRNFAMKDLGTPQTYEITTSAGTATVTGCPMACVKTYLNNDSTSTAVRNALVALVRVWQAYAETDNLVTMDYVDRSLGAVGAEVDEAVPELIVGTHGSTATASWTGTSTRLSSLRDGTVIRYQLSSAGKANVTLNLTLKDGTTTGAKIVCFNWATRLSTQYAVNNILEMIFVQRGNNGNGAWIVLNPYTNTNTVYNNMSQYEMSNPANFVAGVTGIIPATLIMKDVDCHWCSIVTTKSTAYTKERATNGFILDEKNICFVTSEGSAVAQGGKWPNIIWACGPSINSAYSFNANLTSAEPIYLVGTMHDDGLFYLDSTWWAQSLPTTEDGKVYVYVGMATAVTTLTLAQENTAYVFYEGRIRTLVDAQRMKAVAALRTRAELAFASACQNNRIIYDDYGNPSVMVYIPPFKYSEIASISGASDTPMGGFWVGKYEASLIGDVAVSVPGVDPTVSVTYAQAKQYCEDKGDGWHLMTREEWAAIELWCLKTNNYPRGNAKYGKHTWSSAPEGVPTSIDSDTNLTGRIATGSGPLSYSHNKEPSGVWDMAGNVREILDGVRLVYGEVQVLDGDTWKAINATDGTLVTPVEGGTMGSVKADYISGNIVFSMTIGYRVANVSCWTKNVTADSTIGAEAVELLQRLCLLPISYYTSQQQGVTYLWNNTATPIYLEAGGKYNDVGPNENTNRVGIDSYNLVNVITNASSTTGFRVAYREPTRGKGGSLPVSGDDDFAEPPAPER